MATKVPTIKLQLFRAIYICKHPHKNQKGMQTDAPPSAIYTTETVGLLAHGKDPKTLESKDLPRKLHLLTHD